MRIIVCGVAVALLFAVTGAEAAWFKRNKNKRTLPKAIDWPIVRPKLDDSHKPGKRVGRHPEIASLRVVAPARG